MTKLIYLAAPFSDPDPMIRDERTRAVNETAAKLLAAGVMIFSPLSHSVPIYHAGNGHFAHNHDVWYEHGLLMASKCDSCLVLMLPGWNLSRGVKLEIDYFREAGKPVEYVSPQTTPTTGKKPDRAICK